MLKEVGGTILCLVFLHFNISLKLPFFKLVLHLYARQTILIFGCLFPPPRERKSIYKNAKKMFINATVTIPQSGGGKKKKKSVEEKPKIRSVYNGRVLTNVTTGLSTLFS